MPSIPYHYGRTEIPWTNPPAPPPVRPRRKPKEVRPLGPIDPLSKSDRQFLYRLRRGPIPKRLLQQTLARDFPAVMFNRRRERLVKEGYIALRRGRYSLTWRGAEAIRDVQSEDLSIPRRAITARGYVEFFGGCDRSGPGPYRKLLDHGQVGIHGRAGPARGPRHDRPARTSQPARSEKRFCGSRRSGRRAPGSRPPARIPAREYRSLPPVSRQ